MPDREIMRVLLRDTIIQGYNCLDMTNREVEDHLAIGLLELLDELGMLSEEADIELVALREKVGRLAGDALFWKMRFRAKCEELDAFKVASRPSLDSEASSL